jgi:hypothetical protein
MRRYIELDPKEVEHPYQREMRLDLWLRRVPMDRSRTNKRRVERRDVSLNDLYHGELSRDDV